jgi:ABC-type nitrate/sulfonate/bicarbonate transport system substrate-binding protein
MKKSMLMKIVAALAIGAAFPLGASAAQSAKTTTQQSVIQNVKAPEVKAPRKHYFAQPWMDSGS